jgi:D-sedoheptulose 7-phosphate isomerase
VQNSISDLIDRMPALAICGADIAAAVEMIAAGGKILICGNGGSASDSEHLVADLMKPFMVARPIPAADRESFSQPAAPRPATWPLACKARTRPSPSARVAPC